MMAICGERSTAGHAYARFRKRIPGWALRPLRRIGVHLQIQIIRCFYADRVVPTLAQCPPQYVARFVPPASLRDFARDPDLDMTQEFVAEALAKGDECFGILDGPTLAAYSWYSSKPTRAIPQELFVHFDNRYIYMYKGFTRERYRGQRLHAIGKTLALQAYMARGLRGMVSLVEVRNSDSLRSAKRIAARVVGSFFILGVFGHFLIYRTRGCRRFGVRIEREHPARRISKSKVLAPSAK
jgi:hypothetical protein